jgi:hypothetical protein
VRQLLGSLSQLVQQSRILDGDDCLRSKILHQRDLLVGEEANLLAKDSDRADHLIVFEHRHAQ